MKLVEKEVAVEARDLAFLQNHGGTRPPTPVVWLRTRRPLRPARPGLLERTELGSLSRTGKALLDPRPGLVPAQPRKTAEGGLGATLHLGDPCGSVACLDVGLEACEKFRRHACALAFGKLQGLSEHVFCVVVMTK